MFVQCLIFMVSSLVCEGHRLPAYGTELPLRIAGGVPADIKDYPYQVSLDLDGELCGGAIISPKLILTAAHCTRSKDPNLITVRVGSNFTQKEGQVISVLEVHEHPSFDPESFDSDVAVIKLQSSLEYGETIKAISLAPESYIIESYTLATVTGYGYITHLGPASNSLRKVDLPLLSTEECQYIYGEEITQRMFCAGYDVGGKDACDGDSGGPLVRDDQVIGIVSFGPDCASAGMPGAYAKVSSLRPFIDEIMKAE